MLVKIAEFSNTIAVAAIFGKGQIAGLTFQIYR